MSSSYKTLALTKINENILQVTLNRPESRNALNSEMMKDLGDFWNSNYHNNSEIRCIILSGSGDKAFCAGADLKERHTINTEVWLQQHSILEQAMISMSYCPIPIIAAINGCAYGGGLELVLASDFSYASNTAQFSFPETKLGIIPGARGTQNLPRACGIRRAKEICYTGKSFSAEEALEWNIINKICAPNDLMQEVLSTAQKISKCAPLAITQVKKSLNMTQLTDLNTGYLFEIEAYTKLIGSKDSKEGIHAFNEKRTPVFTGE